jgi:N-acetylmuramic acid 6-phosphate etherase
MKAGTVQKLILNSITTATMINLGHIKGSKMIDMKLSNEKLKGRAELIVIEATGVDLVLAQKLIKENGGVRGAIDAFNKK